MSTGFIFLDLRDHTDLSQALLFILQCRVAYIYIHTCVCVRACERVRACVRACVCVCVCTATLEMASQTGRQIQSISMLFKFNFLHTMIEFKTFSAHVY